MSAKGRVFGACVVSAALLVAGCSSGGGKQSTPTTVRRTATSTLAGPTGFESGGPNGPATSCPSERPGESVPRPPVQGLKQTLVPIAASSVRICEYKVPKQLERSGRVVAPATVKPLEDTANRLPRSTDAACDQPVRAPSYVATFANEDAQVNLVMDPCGFVTNGVRGAQSNTKWLNELQRYATSVAVPDVVGEAGSAAGALVHLGWRVTFKGARCCVGVVVVGQNPRAGALAPLGSTVTLTLAPPGPTGPGAPPGPTGPGGGTKPTGGPA